MRTGIKPKVVEPTKCPLCKYPGRHEVTPEQQSLLCMYHLHGRGQVEWGYAGWKRRNNL